MAGRAKGPRRLAALALRLGPLADRSDRGATATEYALLVGFIAIVIAISLGFFGSQLSGFYHQIASDVGLYL
jgi:pilus assembly protein Flp/PilA